MGNRFGLRRKEKCVSNRDMPANKSPAASHGDELIIPFLFVPEGQSPPEDRLQARPGPIRIPATVVLRRDGSIAGIKLARNERAPSPSRQLPEASPPLPAMPRPKPPPRHSCPIWCASF